MPRPELLDLIGFRPDSGYGGIESRARIARGEYALGELKPAASGAGGCNE